MTTLVLGHLARDIDDRVTEFFDVGELTHELGWWEDDVEGESARYAHLAHLVLEPVRKLLAVPMRCLSGARPIGHNEGGRASSLHLPPVQRADPRYAFLTRPIEQRGAALDFVPGRGMPCDVAFWLIDRAQRAGTIRPGGLFWYAPTPDNPGPMSGRFLHIDDRGEIARESDKIPPRVRP